MKKIGIYPGTFDPITFGHIDVVKRSLKIVDKVYIVNEGAIFFEGDPKNAINNEKIKKFYLGSDFSL